GARQLPAHVSSQFRVPVADAGDNVVDRSKCTRWATVLQAIEPVAIALGGIGDGCVWNVQAVQRDQVGNTFGTSTGIHAGRLAAHAVTGQYDRLIRGQRGQQRV